LPILVLALTLMVCFLNMRGYVNPKHWVYIPSLSEYSEKGGLFDKETMMRVVPSLLQVISILILARINKMASKLTTRWENHRTQTGFNNSVIIKRFIFEVLYIFIHLAYIGFWRLDIAALQKELVLLFASDEIRRLVSETIIPYCFKVRRDRTHYHLDSKKNDAASADNEKEYITRKVQEISLDEYDSFDDYLEMIIQFGYITMFAAAFPLSGVFSLVFNGVEILSDYYKLKNLHRRPLPAIVNGIGSYKEVIDVMSYLCILTNCVLIACNFWRAQEEAGVADKQGDSTFGKVILAEHIILVVVYLIRKFLHDEPFWVRIYLKRRNNLKKGL
jgi:anoctamin-10